MAAESTGSREANRNFAFPFQNRIEMQEAGRPEEVPMQEIVIKNIQNFTREDFDQAKKDLDNHKDGDTNLKGFKYTYCPEQKTKNKETHSQETKKVEKTTTPSKKDEQKEALRTPATTTGAYSPSSDSTEEKGAAHPIEEKSDLMRRPPRHLKPIPGVRLKKLPVREEDVADENASFLISRFR